MFCCVGATLSCGLESRLYFHASSLQLIYICIRRPPPLFFPAFSETSVTIISSSSSSSSLSLSIFHSPLLLSAFRLIASLSVRRSAHLSSILRGSATAGREPTHVRHRMLFASHPVFQPLQSPTSRCSPTHREAASCRKPKQQNTTKLSFSLPVFHHAAPSSSLLSSLVFGELDRTLFEAEMPVN